MINFEDQTQNIFRALEKLCCRSAEQRYSQDQEINQSEQPRGLADVFVFQPEIVCPEGLNRPG